ncbi:hypothetical protein GQ43DRAFT_103997 [Delitschia confertaspora ATCC 74209]|uniref:Uncharacterized protein n=1 Tax=Delitschia confertaspora ATCC 74209 TaxID=1513339 RepID=A0A9P4MU64_9PLEO|nr:hypothetical protein GQ43DRAFT_103997 [Delitschia confertaspora ATCC 74209]
MSVVISYSVQRYSLISASSATNFDSRTKETITHARCNHVNSLPPPPPSYLPPPSFRSTVFAPDNPANPDDPDKTLETPTLADLGGARSPHMH